MYNLCSMHMAYLPVNRNLIPLRLRIVGREPSPRDVALLFASQSASRRPQWRFAAVTPWPLRDPSGYPGSP